MADEFDLESYRYEHESSTEWNLRKQFLDSHHDKFTKNRLVCLSNCYINVELYGCSYPDELMIQLKTLIEDLEGLQDHSDQVKERNEVKFVKASNENGGDNGPSPAKKNKGILPFDNPTNSADNNKPSTSQDVVIANVNDKCSQFYRLASCLRVLLQEDLNRFKKDYLQMVTIACTRAQLTIDTEFLKQVNGGFKCNMFIDGVFIASTNGSKKKFANREAFELAFKVLIKPYIQVLKISTGRFELNTSDSPIDGGESNLKNTYNLTSPVDKKIMDTAGGFIKLGTSTQGNINSIARSVAKKRQAPTDISLQLKSFILVEPIVLKHSFTPVGLFSESAGFNKVSVTYETRLVGELDQTVLLIGGETVSESNLSGKEGKKESAEKALNQLRETNWTLIRKCKSSKNESIQDNKLCEAIPDSNVGSKLLKMMGWTGGGYDRGPDERFLTVSKVTKQAEIIQHVASRGGETEKYRLIPPGEYEQIRSELSGNWSVQ